MKMRMMRSGGIIRYKRARDRMCKNTSTVHPFLVEPDLEDVAHSDHSGWQALYHPGITRQ